MDRSFSSSNQADHAPPDVVLYHAECSDGFGAAWAIWKKYPKANITRQTWDSAPDQLGGAAYRDRRFQLRPPGSGNHGAEAESLLVLDHHITAQEALAGLPYAYFDLTKSGAVLGWEWAHGQPAPWLLQYIQDKDLWTWALPGSREINAALASYPFDFNLWNTFTQARLEQEGTAILATNRNWWANLRLKPSWLNFKVRSSLPYTVRFSPAKSASGFPRTIPFALSGTTATGGAISACAREKRAQTWEPSPPRLEEAAIRMPPGFRLRWEATGAIPKTQPAACRDRPAPGP